MALPLLIAGPIVRRVDARSASVWVACSKPASIELVLFEGHQESTGPGKVNGDARVHGRGTVATRRLGPNLHVAVAFADGTPDPRVPNDPGWVLRPGALYSYDILISPDNRPPIRPVDGPAVGLLGLHLLSDDPVAGGARVQTDVWADAPIHRALGYGPNRLPSFVTIAPQLADIRIAHTSCRKVHGPGTDALSWLDARIEKHLDDPAQRIQQLFLTGDQIYADDVPTCILPMYHDLAMKLMGDGDASGEEELPTRAHGMRNVNLATAPPMRRTRLVRSDGGFSSVECQNHLLTVGEYAASCLTAWSPRAWLPLADEDRCYEHCAAVSDFSLSDLVFLFTNTHENDDRPADAAQLRARLKLRNKADFDAQRQRVIVYAATVGRVARVLANTPTYMVFDDHDVTDDWNINKTWQDRVYSKPLGRTVVRNALVAYTFFQAWGNDWRSFADPDSVNGRTLRAAEAYLVTTRGRPMQERELLDKLFDLKGEGGADRANFHYEVPGSLYQVRVLDSRTRRTFPIDRVGAPALLGDSLDLQLPKNPPEAGLRFALVVAATPVLGPEILEHMIWPVMSAAADVYRASRHEEDAGPQDHAAGEHHGAMSEAMSRTRGAMFVHVETWPANQVAQHELLGRLANWGGMVVLGGDVHYGTNLHLDWWERDPDQGAALKVSRIVQLTASGSRNAETMLEPLFRSWHWLGMWGSGPAIEGLGWKRGHQIDTHGKYVSVLRSRMVRAEPSIVPSRGWPAGTTELEAPHWRFRQLADRDIRPDAERTAAFRALAEQLQPDLAAAVASPSVREQSHKLVALHAKACSIGFAPLRDMVLTNNVGLVRFEEDAEGGVSVVHSLLSTNEQGYPENEVDDALPARRPLGSTARVSSGDAHSEVRVALAVPQPEAHPILEGNR